MLHCVFVLCCVVAALLSRALLCMYVRMYVSMQMHILAFGIDVSPKHDFESSMPLPAPFWLLGPLLRCVYITARCMYIYIYTHV